jgi:hypothetical protein
MHHVGMAIHDARRDLSCWRPAVALKRILNRTTMESTGAVVEQMRWIRRL